MKQIGTLLLGLVMLVPVALAHDDDERKGRRDAGFGRDASEYALERGYQDGMRHGARDRARRAGYNYRSDEWRHADRGYERHMGSHGQYKQGYRNGYVRGYEVGYYGRNRDDRWGRDRRDDDWGRDRRTDRNGYPNGGYGNGGYDSRYLVQQAQQNGHAEGVHYGQMDRRNGHSNRPTEVKGYKDADRGYSSSLGSRDDYKRIFREAFIRGYQQGYGSGYYRR